MAFQHVYSISVDFISGINESQLQNELIEASLLCTHIISDDDTVTIHFSEGTLQESVDPIVAAHVPIYDSSTEVDQLKLSRIENVTYMAQRLNLNLPASTETDVTGAWNNSIGSLPGFDTSTGIYTVPETGIYSIKFRLETNGANLNDYILIKMKDNQNNVITAEVCSLTTNVPTYASMDHSGIFSVGDIIKFSLEVPIGVVSVDCIFSILQLMIG